MKHKKVIIALSVLMLLSGCKEKDTTPPPITSVQSISENTIQEAAAEETVEIKREVHGYILDDSERQASEGVNIHNLGDIEETQKPPVIISSDSISENTTRPEETETDKPEVSEPVDLSNIKIYIDPGHGGDAACETEFEGIKLDRAAGGSAIGEFPANSLGTTVGTSGGGYIECDVVYQIANKTKNILAEKGYSVELSREDVHPAALGGGTAIGNWERGRRAAEYDAWIVFHADGGGGKGIHCVVYDSDNSYSSSFYDDFIRYMENKGRTIYTASGFNHGYSGNSSGTLQAPSMYLQYGGDIQNMLYIETGFMDDSEDLEYMVSEEGMTDIANAVLYAVNKHFAVGDTTPASTVSE